MPEGFGDRIIGVLKKVGEVSKRFARESLPDRPETVSIERINPQSVAAAYKRWLNFSPHARFVREENQYPPFTLAKILWALGYLGKHEPLDQYIDPHRDELSLTAARKAVYETLSQLQQAGIINLVRRAPERVSVGQLNYFYKIPEERRETFARIAEGQPLENLAKK